MGLLRDRVGDFAIRVTALSSDPVTVIVEGIQREIELTSSAAAIGRKDHRTGDPAFDRRVASMGNNVLLRALLGHECRKQWLQALDAFPGLSASQGRVVCRLRSPSHEEVQLVAECMAALAARFAPLGTEALFERLSAVVRRDEVAEVRARALETLCGRFPGPLSANIGIEALGDRDAVVRFHAALLVGAPGFEVLEGLLADPDLAPHLRSQVARAGIRSLPRDRALGPLLGLLVAPHEESVRVAATRTLAGYRLREAVPSLCAVLREAPPSVRPALVDALGLLGDAQIEPVLLGSLEDGDPDEKRSAIKALARVGTILSVGPLREVAASFRRDSTEAVARIQARTRGAGAGQLSTPSPNRAAGSLAVTETGTLTTPTPDRRRS